MGAPCDAYTERASSLARGTPPYARRSTPRDSCGILPPSVPSPVRAPLAPRRRRLSTEAGPRPRTPSDRGMEEFGADAS